MGVAPKTNMFALKTCDNDYREIAAAINWSVENGIRIISISGTVSTNYSDLYTACKYAFDNGRLLFAAAGNEGSGVDYPAKYPFVIAVGSVNQSDVRDPLSNFGPELDFVAPGTEINSTFLDGGYAVRGGTSMACPCVAGVAALIWSSRVDPAFDIIQDGQWENVEVWNKLVNMSLDLGPPGREDEYGYGLINAWATNQRPLGDIDNSLQVDMVDMWIAQNAFGSIPSMSNWDPRADININNMVDMVDMWIIQNNYGKTARNWPDDP